MNWTTAQTRFRVQEHSLFFSLMLLALANGILFIFLIPPWQHYDEPGHFEFAWLIANRQEMPTYDDYDQSIRREIAASMLENKFFNYLNFKPDLFPQQKPIWIGEKQVSDHFLYHWIVALPLKVIRGSDILLQLYVGRLVSLGFGLLTLLAAYGIVCEITQSSSPLRWLVIGFLALSPTFLDLATSLNDDIGVTAFSSLALWGVVRLVKRGFSLKDLLFALLFTYLSIRTKMNSGALLIVTPLAILFSVFKSNRFISWIAILLGFGVFISFSTEWGDAAEWTRQTLQASPIRVKLQSSPIGKYAFQLTASRTDENAIIFQPIPPRQSKTLRGKTITLGAWIWSNKPTWGQTPLLLVGNNSISKEIEISTTPTFHSITTTLTYRSQPIWLILTPSTAQDESVVYYDGITMGIGDLSNSQPPVYEGPNSTYVYWEGESFENPVRNASAENGSIKIRTWADKRFIRPGLLSLALGSAMDWGSYGDYFDRTFKNLFMTFWGKFGWDKISYSGVYTYTIFLVFSLIGVVGAGVALSRKKFHIDWAITFIFIIFTLGIWIPAILRGFDHALSIVFIPSARYLLPAIIPLALLLNTGWIEIASSLGKIQKKYYSISMIVLWIFFAGTEILGIWTIARYFN